MEIKVKKLVPEAVVPTRAHGSDAGFDLVAVSRTLEAGAWVYGTGLAFEIPEGYVGLVFPRSSVAKKDVILSNCVGVIDAGYRPFVRSGGFSIYDVGERICQIVFVKLPEVEIVESDELSTSDRGTGGYGSTGK